MARVLLRRSQNAWDATFPFYSGRDVMVRASNSRLTSLGEIMQKSLRFRAFVLRAF